MLINLTNTPSFAWDKTQIDEAVGKYARITDIPFPIVSPWYSLAEVEKTAQEYFERIEAVLELYNEENAVHIKGDNTFTFILLDKLRKAGIKAITSTFMKVMNEKDNDSQYEFIMFREYY
jgi:hypothetical protein